MKIDDLVSRLAKTPGLTRRNATKMLFHFIRNKEKIRDFVKIFESVEEEIKVCASCGNISFGELCDICANDRRDHSIICVVEDFEGIANLERGVWYTGIYHVLGGLLSAGRGMMPENLNIASLMEKVRQGLVSEIIFASTSSFEWQATMHLMVGEIKKISSTIKITEFAHGLPIGSSFEYMDEGTLHVAFTARKGV